MKEKNYDFRKRLLCLHTKDLRDPEAVGAGDELEIADGFTIVLPPYAGDIMRTAARDFADYLLTSMNVSVAVAAKDCAGHENFITLSIASETGEDLRKFACYMGYRIKTSALGMDVCGYDERGIAQALYYLEDVMNLRRAPFVKMEIKERKPLFTPRVVGSGYGVEDFPDEHLAAIAHAGMDAVYLYVTGINSTEGHKFLDFNSLILRASKYGIDVYALSSLKSEMHPDDEGAAEYYDGGYGRLFESCPGMKGVILVGESGEFPSKDPHVTGRTWRDNVVDGIPTGRPSPGWWPCCDYPKLVKIVRDAVKKYKSDADVVLCTYNWGWAPEEERIKLIKALPDDVAIMATFETFESYKVGEASEIITDYTLSSVGPGKYFESEAKAAKARGQRLYTISNTAGLTWDFGVIPYDPMPYQWIKRFRAVVEANKKWGLCGLFESIHYGFYPSFVSELAKWTFFEPAENLEDILKKILTRDYGKANAGKAEEALKRWSAAITCYTPTNEDQYGAFRIGPSYPLCLDRILKPPAVDHAMFGDRIFFTSYLLDYGGIVSQIQDQSSPLGIRLPAEIASLLKMRDLIAEGVDILDGTENDSEKLFYLKNLGKFILCCVQTGITAKKWFLLKTKLLTESSRSKTDALILEMEKLANAEIENARSAIKLVEADSRLGWEPSMEYMCDAAHIEWKIRQVKYMLDFELASYKRSNKL